jgi:hypothetical protein
MIDGWEEPSCSSHDPHWVDTDDFANGEWIRLDFLNTVTVGRVEIDTGNAWSPTCLGSGRTLAAGTIQYWNGASWITAGSVSGRTDDWSYSFSSPVSTTRLRIYNIYATDVTGQKSNPVIFEWRVYCD